MTLSVSIGIPSPAEQIWSVGQLSAAMNRLIDGALQQVWVRGEVVQCKVWSSGHWYFTLRDRKSQMKCCMFRLNASRAGKPPADGTEVLCPGQGRRSTRKRASFSWWFPACFRPARSDKSSRSWSE